MLMHPDGGGVDHLHVAVIALGNRLEDAFPAPNRRPLRLETLYDTAVSSSAVGRR
jgi:hypothetical protein